MLPGGLSRRSVRSRPRSYRSGALGGGLDRRAVVARPPDGREAGAERRDRGVRRRELGREPRLAALKGLDAPHPVFAPAHVVPPPDLVALRIDARRDAIAGPFLPRRQTTLDAGREVERVDLEGALVVAAVDDPVGPIAGPLRETEARRTEPPLPRGLGHRAVTLRSHATRLSV